MPQSWGGAEIACPPGGITASPAALDLLYPSHCRQYRILTKALFLGPSVYQAWMVTVYAMMDIISHCYYFLFQFPQRSKKEDIVSKQIPFPLHSPIQTVRSVMAKGDISFAAHIHTDCSWI